MENLSIFNIDKHADAINNEMYGQRSNLAMFDVRVDEGKSTTFIIRMMPYVKDIMHSKMQKYFYVVPNGSNFVFYDSMTTFNDYVTKKYHFCPISHIWMACRNNPDPSVKAVAERLRRQVSIVSYVQVIACPAKPEFNGKILPMKVPIDLDKAINNLANPSDSDIALGKKPITAMDLFKGVEIECTITGHKPRPTDPVMRKWTIAPDKHPSEAKFPLGPNGSMVPVSTLQEQDVIDYFTAQQTVDIVDVFGYKQPNFDDDQAVYRWLHQEAGWIPGMAEEIDKALPHVVTFLKSQELGAIGGTGGANEPTATEQVTYNAGNPMSQPAPQAQQPQPAQEAQQPQPAQEAQQPQPAQEAQQPQPAQNAQPAQSVQHAGITIP